MVAIAEHQFPLIAKLARKYLCVCATSVPSERLFSIGGKIVDGRSRLKPDKVNELIPSPDILIPPNTNHVSAHGAAGSFT